MCVFKIGDIVEIIYTYPKNMFFKIGDTAVLTSQDEDGEWWGDFEHYGPDEDRNWCLQSNITVFKRVSCDDVCDFQKIIRLTDEYIAAMLAYYDRVAEIPKINTAKKNLDAHLGYLKKTYTKKLGPGCQ